jgi:hypothetical protein
VNTRASLATLHGGMRHRWIIRFRPEHAVTRPAFAKAAAGLRQSAHLIPSAPPMLGAGQREIQNQNPKN